MLRKLGKGSWMYDYELLFRTLSVRLRYNVGGRKEIISLPITTYFSLFSCWKSWASKWHFIWTKSLLAQNVLENFSPEGLCFADSLEVLVFPGHNFYLVFNSNWQLSFAFICKSFLYTVLGLLLRMWTMDRLFQHFEGVCCCHKPILSLRTFHS